MLFPVHHIEGTMKYMYLSRNMHLVSKKKTNAKFFLSFFEIGSDMNWFSINYTS